jgi:SAM-dependent methyltransferase
MCPMKTSTPKQRKAADRILQQDCPVCRNYQMMPFFQIESVPVFCNVLFDGRKKAMAAPTARINLAYCNNCGLINNVAFDHTLTRYSPAYENSLHFSQRFQKYAQQTAERLVNQYQLNDKDIIEIGCGRGDFLEILNKLGNNRVIGFDPSYNPNKNTDLRKPEVKIIPELYSEAFSDYPADFICSRHVLEHIHNPLDFLKSIRRAIARRKHCVVYFEVPNALYTLEQMGLWDIIYEHCSYFTSQSLANIFLQAGFEPIEVTERYDGQFLTIEARPTNNHSSLTPDHKWSIPNIHQLLDNFKNSYSQKTNTWRNTLSDLQKQKSPVVIWGAGSKGITFANTLDISHKQIEYIVDLNPRKHGKFTPGTGQRIIAPDFLKEYRPRTIIIMNPIYTSEIKAIIRDLGLTANVLFA